MIHSSFLSTGIGIHGFIHWSFCANTEHVNVFTSFFLLIYQARHLVIVDLHMIHLKFLWCSCIKIDLLIFLQNYILIWELTQKSCSLIWKIKTKQNLKRHKGKKQKKKKAKNKPRKPNKINLHHLDHAPRGVQGSRIVKVSIIYCK